MSHSPAGLPIPDHSQPRLAECRKLLSAWVELDAERSRLTQSLYSSSQSPDQITFLLDQNEQRRASLMAATEALLRRMSSED